MLVPLAAIWVPTAVGIALAAGVLALLVWVRAGPDADEPDSDSDGGGGGRRRPRRPPPVGPVSWQDFERQFAAYVESCAATAGREPGLARGGRERAPNAAAHARRGG